MVPGLLLGASAWSSLPLLDSLEIFHGTILSCNAPQHSLIVVPASEMALLRSTW